MTADTPLMDSYARLPVAFARGAGAWLYDGEERVFLDALAGIAVCGLGHAHPVVAEALADQAHKLLHTSNLYEIPLQARLARELTRLSAMSEVFFANSGAEANEAAIKIARLHGHRLGIGQPLIIVMEGGFHGRTLATLSATGNRKVQAGFEPLVRGFVRVPYNDLRAVAEVADRCPDVVAVLVEPVQGEGGVVIPEQGYLAGLAEICARREWLLMLDEIQTGIGRTGAWFACQHERVAPDVMTLAKALGNGMPIGACLAGGRATGVIRPGQHGSTFGGNPLACRAALAVLEVMDREHLVQRAGALGELLVQGLREELAGLSGVREIRGLGLMVGIELDRPCGELVMRALEAGLLINVTAGTVIRLLPPLIMDDAQLAMLIEKLGVLLKRFLAS